MKRFIAGFVGLGILAGLPATVALGAGTASPVYTPARLRAALAHNPTRWVGRTVLVRGVVVGYLGVTPSIPTFMTGKEVALPGALGLTWGAEDRTLAFLRHLPLVGQFAPPPQQVRWNAQAVYRVRLHVMARSSMCVAPPCYAATLLDAAPTVVPGNLLFARANPLPMPIPLWHGPARVAPIPLWRGPTHVAPLPYRPPIARPDMGQGSTP